MENLISAMPHLLNTLDGNYYMVYLKMLLKDFFTGNALVK